MTTTVQPEWPVKRREMIEWAADSRPWNDLKFRDDDIVVCTWSKSGTTWMQQILAQLILDADPEVYGPDISPWIDFRLTPDALAVAEAQTHRRFLKSHLPIEAIVYSPNAKYIYLARDIRDTMWSWHNHHLNFTSEILEVLQSLPGMEPGRASYPDPDPRVAFRTYLERDGWPCWPFFGHVQAWFDARHLPNLKLVHFNALKNDLEGEIRSIADFLGIEIDNARVPGILEHTSLDHMKSLARKSDILPRIFKQGADTLIHKGTNGRWRDVLTLDDIAFCDATAARNLSADCARWLATGELPS